MDRIRRWYVKRITSRYPEKRSLRRPSFAARYRVARDRRLNTPFPAVRDFIGAQGGGGDADRLHFGFAKMSFCGCEVIAVYNALLHLGSWRDIRRVAQDLMAHGAVFGGLLGVRPDAIASYFSRNHFPVRFEVFTENGAEVTADGLAKPEAEPEAASPDEEPAVTATPETVQTEPETVQAESAGSETVQAEDAGPEAVREEAAEAVQAEPAGPEAGAAGDAAPKKEMHRIPEECVELLTFWNGPDKWTIHTVMIEPLENGMLRVYNRHTNTLYTIYSSYEQFLSASDVVPIARITVGQREYEEDLSEIEPEEAGEAPAEEKAAVEEVPAEVTAAEAAAEVPSEEATEAAAEVPSEEAAEETVEEAAEEAAEETFQEDVPEVTAAEEAGTLPEEIPEAQKTAPESQNCGGQ